MIQGCLSGHGSVDHADSALEKNHLVVPQLPQVKAAAVDGVGVADLGLTQQLFHFGFKGRDDSQPRRMVQGNYLDLRRRGTPREE